jgi:hypothetical protein
MVLSIRIIEGMNHESDGNCAGCDYIIIELPWYEKGNIIRPRFKVKQETVKEVLAGLNELREDKKTEEVWGLEGYIKGNVCLQ